MPQRCTIMCLRLLQTLQWTYYAHFRLHVIVLGLFCSSFAGFSSKIVLICFILGLGDALHPLCEPGADKGLHLIARSFKVTFV